MSDFFKEDGQQANDNYGFTTRASQADEASSTLFSAPREHKDKKAAGKYSLVVRACAILVAVAIVCVAAWGISILVDPREEKPIGEALDTTVLYSHTAENVSKLTVTHSGGSYTLNATEVEEKGKKTTQFHLEGFDNELIDKTSTSQVVSAVLSLSSMHEVEDTGDLGFDNPTLSFNVVGNGIEDYTVTFGKVAPDNSNLYTKYSGAPDKIYLTSSDILQSLVQLPLNFAITTPIKAVEKNSANAAYFDSESGTLADFDTITISGKKFGKTLVFAPNDNKTFSAYATYLCISPQKRIADKVADVFDIFANGLSVSGSVSFSQSDEAIKYYGLDNPDWVITLKLGNETHTYRINKSEDIVGTYYVASTLDSMVRTVTEPNLPFINNTESDFYASFLVLETITEVNSFSLSGEINADFKIKLTQNEDGENVYDITVGDKKIDETAFKSFYANFISTSAFDFNTSQLGVAPDLTITISHTGGEAPTVLTFTKSGESRYQYSVGGAPMGQITLNAYNRLVKEANDLLK